MFLHYHNDHATKNFFLGAENGKAAAFLYTSREYADEFVKGLEMVGVETKVLEIRPLQRISFFNDLYRSGFEAVVIDKGQENHMSMSLFSIIEKPKDTSEIVMNPSLVRSANQFYQALVQHQAFPQMQDLMCKELYGARLLVPVADPQKTTAVPVLTTGKGVRYYPAFTDLVEFGKFDRKHQFGAMEVRFRDLKKYLDYVNGIVVNPFGFALRLDGEKLVFTKGVFRNLAFIAQHTDYELVMVSNQDGLGTDSFPENTFWPVHNFIIQTLESEGIHFAKQHIDRHFPEDNSPMRKPGTGMLTEYIDNPAYDMANSYVIGDRETDAQLAENLGCKSLILGKDGMDWDKIAEILFAGDRIAEVKRTTKETDIYIKVNLDGSGKCDISTGLGFFDHMLEQIGKHGMMDLTIHTKGDLYVDEHHTIEDTGIALGECLLQALGDKRGIERYGYSLPMDDCLCQVALDFGGRPWLIWDAEFHREKVGEMPTEMFKHFFKSLSDAAKMNLNIKAEGENEHHKIEGIFKALARSLKMAVKRDIYHFELPSSKGML